MTYRVVQWATGNLGRAAIEGIVSHPELELLGVWVHTDSKVGKDAGELAERPDLNAETIEKNGECFAMTVEGDPPVYITTHGVQPTRGMDWAEVQRRNPGMVGWAKAGENGSKYRP